MNVLESITDLTKEIQLLTHVIAFTVLEKSIQITQSSLHLHTTALHLQILLQAQHTTLLELVWCHYVRVAQTTQDLVLILQVLTFSLVHSLGLLFLLHHWIVVVYTFQHVCLPQLYIKF
jgi:hypothetical protein